MSAAKENRYVEAIGRRKRSTARVRIQEAGKTTITVNDRPVGEYFPTAELQNIIREPILAAEIKDTFSISVKISGGGVHGQAEAVRHGLSRALSLWKTELRQPLKAKKLLARDDREKERRKFGLKKARKAPQWSKR